MKNTAYSISDSLADIFNLSIHIGISPDDWKIAYVTPIYTDGPKTDCGNYRPISIIWTVTKLFEKFVYKQLINYLNENSIITKEQSGFRSNHSTETAALSSTNKWLMNMDERLINDVIFLNLKKVFDTVDHNILISKLNIYGVKRIVLRWFQSYPLNRVQICEINQKLSDAERISSGVPQGTNFRSLLFLICINNLPNCLNSTKAVAQEVEGGRGDTGPQ